MQTPILILMLACGIPGANSCTAQQESLPRVGQAPAATPPAEQKPVVADTDDDDGDDEAEGAEAMAKQAEAVAEDAAEEASAELPAQAKSGCQAHCQAQEPAQAAPQGQLGRVVTPMKPARVLTLSAPVTRLGKKDLALGGQCIQIEPGQTVIVEPVDGQPLTINTQGLSGLQSTEAASIPTLSTLFAAQATPQNQDERVRELEKRVRELEAQLRERDNQQSRSAPRAYRDPLGRAQAEEERARASEMRERMGAQARDYARRARQQADEIRKQADVLRKQALEQAEQWRAYSVDPNAQKKWKFDTGGMSGDLENSPFVYSLPRRAAPPAAPEAPEAAEAPEAPAEGWWSRAAPTPAAPKAMRSKSPKPPKEPKEPKMAGGEQAQELRAMMEQMRVQMEEMRAQMQALRDELQKAPQREMR